MSPKKDTQESTKNTPALNKQSKGFTDEERAAMKNRAQELKAKAREQRQGGRGKRRTRGDHRNAGTGARHGRAVP